MSVLYLLLPLSLFLLKECDTSAIRFDERYSLQTQYKEDLPNYHNSDVFSISNPMYASEDSHIGPNVQNFKNTEDLFFPKRPQTNTGKFLRTNPTDKIEGLYPVLKTDQLFLLNETCTKDFVASSIAQNDPNNLYSQWSPLDSTNRFDPFQRQSGPTLTSQRQSNYQQIGSVDKFDSLENTVFTEESNRNHNNNYYSTKSLLSLQNPSKTTSYEIVKDGLFEEEIVSLTQVSPYQKASFGLDGKTIQSSHNLNKVPVGTKHTEILYQEENILAPVWSHSRYSHEDCFRDSSVDLNNIYNLNNFDSFDRYTRNAFKDEIQVGLENMMLKSSQNVNKVPVGTKLPEILYQEENILAPVWSHSRYSLEDCFGDPRVDSNNIHNLNNFDSFDHTKYNLFKEEIQGGLDDNVFKNSQNIHKVPVGTKHTEILYQEENILAPVWSHSRYSNEDCFGDPRVDSNNIHNLNNFDSFDHTKYNLFKEEIQGGLDNKVFTNSQNLHKVTIGTKPTEIFYPEESTPVPVWSHSRYSHEDCFRDSSVDLNNNHNLNNFDSFHLTKHNAFKEEVQDENYLYTANTFSQKDNEKIYNSPTSMTTKNNFPREKTTSRNMENYLSTVQDTSSTEDFSNNKGNYLQPAAISNNFPSMFHSKEASGINKKKVETAHPNYEGCDYPNPYTGTNNKEREYSMGTFVFTNMSPQSDATSAKNIENYLPITNYDQNIFQEKDVLCTNNKENFYQASDLPRTTTSSNNFPPRSPYGTNNKRTDDLHNFTNNFPVEEGIGTKKQNMHSTVTTVPIDISSYEKPANTNEKGKEYQHTYINTASEATNNNPRGSQFTNIFITEDTDGANRVSDQPFNHAFTNISSSEESSSKTQKGSDCPVTFTDACNNTEELITCSNIELNDLPTIKNNTEDTLLKQTEGTDQDETADSALTNFLASNHYSSVPEYDEPSDNIGPYVFCNCDNIYFLYSDISYNNDGQPVSYKNRIATIRASDRHFPEIFNSPCIKSCIQCLIPAEKKECLEQIDNSGKMPKYVLESNQNANVFLRNILERIEKCNKSMQLTDGKTVRTDQILEVLQSTTKANETIITVPYLFSGSFEDLYHVLKNFPTNLAKNAFVYTPNGLMLQYEEYCQLIRLCGTDEMLKSTPLMQFKGKDIDHNVIAFIIASETNKEETAAVMPDGYVVPFSIYSKYIHGLTPSEKETIGIVSQYMDKPVSYRLYEEVLQKFLNSNNKLPVSENPNIYLWQTGTEVPLSNFLEVIKYYKKFPDLILELPNSTYISLQEIWPILDGLNLEYTKNCLVHFPNSDASVNLSLFCEFLTNYLER